jgi:hypothetical protein
MQSSNGASITAIRQNCRIASTGVSCPMNSSETVEGSSRSSTSTSHLLRSATGDVGSRWKWSRTRRGSGHASMASSAWRLTTWPGATWSSAYWPSTPAARGAVAVERAAHPPAGLPRDRSARADDRTTHRVLADHPAAARAVRARARGNRGALQRWSRRDRSRVRTGRQDAGDRPSCRSRVRARDQCSAVSRIAPAPSVHPPSDHDGLVGPAFTMPRFRRSRCRGFGVHDAAVSAFTMPRFWRAHDAAVSAFTML